MQFFIQTYGLKCFYFVCIANYMYNKYLFAKVLYLLTRIFLKISKKCFLSLKKYFSEKSFLFRDGVTIWIRWSRRWRKIRLWWCNSIVRTQSQWGRALSTAWIRWPRLFRHGFWRIASDDVPLFLVDPKEGPEPDCTGDTAGGTGRGDDCRHTTSGVGTSGDGGTCWNVFSLFNCFFWLKNKT